jgi:hypothetical protein
MKATLAAIFGLALSCCGCASSIQVSTLDPTTVPTGVPWNLAMTQYTVTITRQVTSCSNLLNGTVTVSAVAGKKLDEDQQYVLNSDGIWATSDITSTLASDGTSTGLNAQSQDQTATVISNTVGFLAALAVGPLGERAAHFDCKQAVKDALAALKPTNGPSLKDKVDQDTKDVAAATAKVTQLTPLYQGGGGTGGGGGGGAGADKTPLITAVNDLLTKQQTLNDDQAKLTANLNVLTTTQTVVWPATAKKVSTDAPFSLDQNVAQSWVDWSGLPLGQKTAPVGTAAFNVWLALYKSDGVGGWAIPSVPPKIGDVKVGVPVRLPHVGRLLACTSTKCDLTLSANWVADDKHTLLIQPDAPVLQFGQLYNVPITGGTFKSEGAVIALDANGVPTSIEVSEKQAAAVSATATLQSTATTLAALPGQIAAARLAATQAQTNQITANNALTAAQAAAPTAGGIAAANAQAAYLNATGALATAHANANAAGQLGQLAAQTAIANQQVALDTQQANLASAQANATVARAVDTLAANTSLINAQAAQINAQVAVAKAQAALQP